MVQLDSKDLFQIYTPTVQLVFILSKFNTYLNIRCDISIKNILNLNKNFGFLTAWRTKGEDGEVVVS